MQEGSATLGSLLVALAAVIVVGQLLGRALARAGQPPVIGEVLAGILLGPSFVGPQMSAVILPPAVAPVLGIIAQLGIILYMFVVGLDLHPGLLAGRARATILTSHASIVLPFGLGVALAWALHTRLAGPDVGFVPFALFMGVAMSITAFPVLARILTDKGMDRSPLGVLALSCAAIDDVTAWCLLAFVVGVTRSQANGGLSVTIGALAYIGCVLLIVRPLMARTVRRWERRGALQTQIAALLTALLLSAAVTEAIGIHAIFGAFLLGAVVPHESAVARALCAQLRTVVTVLLLPAFFAFTGMRTRIDLMAGAGDWLACAAIVAVATVGKFAGTFAGARLTGVGARDAAVLGMLLNTRGLMELVVLNIGLELGVISPRLFAMMVVMAIVTTIMTSPAVSALERSRPPALVS